jgi:hypothetical protein
MVGPVKRTLRRLPPGLKARLRGALGRGDAATPAQEMAALYRRGRPPRSAGGPVLFWVPGGMPLMLHVEGAIAAALKLRGVDVHAVICDGPFRACVKREVQQGVPVSEWHKTCADCHRQTSAVLDRMAIPYSSVGDYVTPATRSALWEQTTDVTWQNLDELSFNGVGVGKNARSAIQRFLQGSSLAGHDEIVREYAYSALVSAAAAAAAFDRLSPSRLFMSHGAYVDWGPALHTALARGFPITAWMVSYLSARFYFRHVTDGVRIDFHNLSDQAWLETRSGAMSAAHDARLAAYFDDRYRKHVTFDMKRFKPYVGDAAGIRRKYARMPDKPVWGILAHINWDTVSDYSPMAYPSFDDWIVDTVRHVIELPAVNWLIKVHPAEAWDNPASGVQRLIDRHFPNLPDHVGVVSAEDNVSPLDFAEMLDGGITVYGTAGLELAMRGKPVILSGEAHYGGKGFTHDGLDRAAYLALLRRAESLPPLTAEQRRLARQYAYCYFIQRQVPLPVVRNPHSTWWEFQHQERLTLLPGRDPFVDFICDRILDGQDFVMDEALVTLAANGGGRP